MKQNKVVTATTNGISITYIDTRKNYFIKYNKENETSLEKQTSGNFKNYQESVNLNPKQIKIYRLAVYGIEVLKENELKMLSQMEKAKLIQDQKETQLVLNRWKQQITDMQINKMLSGLFPNSKFVHDLNLNNNDYYSDTLINYSTFKQLQISNKMIIDKLIATERLPLNFYNI
jgi:archaellin